MLSVILSEEDSVFKNFQTKEEDVLKNRRNE
jgi:hypothetical protein